MVVTKNLSDLELSEKVLVNIVRLVQGGRRDSLQYVLASHEPEQLYNLIVNKIKTSRVNTFFNNYSLLHEDHMWSVNDRCFTHLNYFFIDDNSNCGHDGITIHIFCPTSFRDGFLEDFYKNSDVLVLDTGNKIVEVRV